MDDVDALVQPPDLKTAFDKYPGSADHFNAFGASSQRFVLRWIKLAKITKTATKQIEEVARLATIEEKIKGS